jgi:hypothetical protein
MVLKEVGQAVGFSRRSFTAQVGPTGQHQGAADLLQSDLRIFPPQPQRVQTDERQGDHRGGVPAYLASGSAVLRGKSVSSPRE